MKKEKYLIMANRYEHSLPLGYILKVGNHRYIVEDVLGRGGFGITYKVKSHLDVGNIKINAYFAMKEYFPDFCWRDNDQATVKIPPSKRHETLNGLEDFISEGERLQQVCKLNPNIVNVNEVFRANGTAYYVMEYLSGGDLRKLVKENGGGISEATMMSILLPVASALQSVHSNMILHLDIKPDNIVMRRDDDDSPDVPVLIDFGIAVHFKKDGSPTTKHPSKGLTPGFSPAEQYEGIKRFDPRIDIYALSATCYYMLSGKEPKSAFEISLDDVASELAGRASERTVKAIVQGMSRLAAHRPPSISEFLKLFKETNAMPVGAIVGGNYQNYMIMGVVEETDSFIHYKATTATDSQKHDTKGTKRTIYDLWEYFMPGIHKRQTEGVATSAKDMRGSWKLPFTLAKYSPADYGCQASSHGIIESEYFFNGTEYLVVRQDYKPSPEWVKNLKRHKKTIIATAAIIVALGVISAILLMNPRDKTKQHHEETITTIQAEQQDFSVVSNDSVTNAQLPEKPASETKEESHQSSPATTKDKNREVEIPADMFPTQKEIDNDYYQLTEEEQERVNRAMGKEEPY